MPPRSGGARLIPFGQSPGRADAGGQGLFMGAELLAWMLVGGLFALAARESGRRGAQAIVLAVALASGLSLAIEATQVLIPGRDVDLTSVVLAFSGSAIGATLVVHLAAVDSRRWIVPACLIWGLATLLAAWNPPRFAWPDAAFVPPGIVRPVLVVFRQSHSGRPGRRGRTGGGLLASGCTAGSAARGDSHS